MVDSNKVDSGTVVTIITVVCSKMRAYEEASFGKSVPFWWWVINGQLAEWNKLKEKVCIHFQYNSDSIKHWRNVHGILRVSCIHKEFPAHSSWIDVDRHNCRTCDIDCNGMLRRFTQKLSNEFHFSGFIHIGPNIHAWHDDCPRSGWYGQLVSVEWKIKFKSPINHKSMELNRFCWLLAPLLQYVLA